MTYNYQKVTKDVDCIDCGETCIVKPTVAGIIRCNRCRSKSRTLSRKRLASDKRKAKEAIDKAAKKNSGECRTLSRFDIEISFLSRQIMEEEKARGVVVRRLQVEDYLRQIHGPRIQFMIGCGQTPRAARIDDSEPYSENNVTVEAAAL